MIDFKRFISLMLRIGIAFVFLYASISAFLNPNAWIGFVPFFIQNGFILTLYSTYQFILGIWLISGKKLFIVSLLSIKTLFLLMIFNLGAFDIIFRDVPILLMAIILAVMSYKKAFV